jgi:hypothetical protein
MAMNFAMDKKKPVKNNGGVNTRPLGSVANEVRGFRSNSAAKEPKTGSYKATKIFSGRPVNN